MSLRSFTENLINLVIESCLVRKLGEIFTPALVGDLDDAGVAKLATEMGEVRERRGHLAEEVDMLKAALKTCRHHRPRPRYHTSQTAPAPSREARSSADHTHLAVKGAVDRAMADLKADFEKMTADLNQTLSLLGNTGALAMTGTSNMSKPPSPSALPAGMPKEPFAPREGSTGSHGIGVLSGAPAPPAGPFFHTPAPFGHLRTSSPANAPTGAPSLFTPGPTSSQAKTPVGVSEPTPSPLSGGSFSGASGSAAGPQQTGGNIFSSGSSR